MAPIICNGVILSGQGPRALPRSLQRQQEAVSEPWKESEMKQETWGQSLTLLTNGGAVLVGSLSWSQFTFSVKWVKNACPSNTFPKKSSRISLRSRRAVGVIVVWKLQMEESL